MTKSLDEVRENKRRLMATKRKLKIAFIHPDLGIGGAERLVLDVAIALSKQNHEVFFVSNHFDKTHAFEELKNGEYLVQVVGDWIPRSVFGKCQALCAYIRMIYLSLVYILFLRKKDKPDLYFVDLIPISIPFLKLAGGKVIYYCHHPDLLASTPGGKLKQFYRKPIDWLELKSTGKADVILVNSKYTASVFRKTFPQITKPIKILYPNVAYSYQETVKRMTACKPIYELVPEIKDSARFVFLSLNRFHPAKKLELAVNAMSHLQTMVNEDEWKNVYFLMAGGYDPQSPINADCYTKLIQLTQEKNLEGKVIFLKSPSDNLKAELLISCSCLVYTPVKEHFGIVPLEAMTVEKPVIACNSGGPRETVDHGITGYLCEPEEESMAHFMCRMLKDDNLIEMGLRGKKRLDEKFSYNSFNNCLKQVIECDILNDKKKL